MNHFKKVEKLKGYSIGDVIHIKRYYFGEDTLDFNDARNCIIVDTKQPIDKITIDEATGKDTLWCGKFTTSSTDIANKGVVEKYYFNTTGWDSSTCTQPCNVNQGVMIGSIKCQQCEHCIKHQKPCEFTGNVDWIVCAKIDEATTNTQ